MRIDEALAVAREKLQKVCDRPLLESEILLAYLLQKDRVYLHTHREQELSSQTVQLFFDLVKRREFYEPIEYITQKVSFFSREFFIEPGVLIPRPETELLIEEVSKEMDGVHSVCEIGTGSGIIAIMLKLLFPHIQITATDISKRAIEVAQKNAKLHNVEIEFVQTSFMDGLYKKFDLIISNPPYIAKDYELDPSVLHEPHEALFAGRVGDEMLKKIIDIFVASQGQVLACEMGYDQKLSIEKYLKKYDLTGRFYKDLAGFDRGFIVRKDRK